MADGPDQGNRVCYVCRRAMAVITDRAGWRWFECLACDRAPLPKAAGQ